MHIILGVNSLLRMFVYDFDTQDRHMSTLRVLQGVYTLNYLNIPMSRR